MKASPVAAISLVFALVLACNSGDADTVISHPILRSEIENLKGVAGFPSGTEVDVMGQDDPPAAALRAVLDTSPETSFAMMDKALIRVGFRKNQCTNFNSVGPGGVTPMPTAANYYKITTDGTILTTLVAWPDPGGTEIDVRMSIGTEFNSEIRFETCS